MAWANKFVANGRNRQFTGRIVTKQRGGDFFTNAGATFNWTNSASPLFTGRITGRHKYVVIRKIFQVQVLDWYVDWLNHAFLTYNVSYGSELWLQCRTAQQDWLYHPKVWIFHIWQVKWHQVEPIKTSAPATFSVRGRYNHACVWGPNNRNSSLRVKVRPLGQATDFPHKYTAFKDVRLSTLFSMKRSDSTVIHCHPHSLLFLLPLIYF